MPLCCKLDKTPFQRPRIATSRRIAAAELFEARELSSYPSIWRGASRFPSESRLGKYTMPHDDHALSKVPEVTLAFWIIKVAATTLGERLWPSGSKQPSAARNP
jgi:hypothetical protein